VIKWILKDLTSDKDYQENVDALVHFAPTDFLFAGMT